MDESPRGYDDLKELADKMRVPVQCLLALSKKNDPFFCGMPAQRIDADWFGKVWERFECGTGFHVRRVHYKLISAERPVRGPDGKTYLNTYEQWQRMSEASKWARHLGLVDAADFEDHRNPEPHIFADYGLPDGYSDEPGWCAEDLPEWELPHIPAEFTPVTFGLPDVFVDGYDYSQVDQPYHVELWIEKSTMNDVLMPVCQRWGVNLVTGVGFQSISGVVRMLERIARLPRGKPTRVFYGSDFDPAGDSMPAAVARQVEFYRERFTPEADIKLMPLFLTREQVIRYDLPRIPIKGEDKRKGSFEDRRGEGAVELDALEAIHPGELAEIVTEAVAPYRDETLKDRLGEAEEEALDAARQAMDEATEPHREELDELADEANEIARRYEARLRELDAELQAELAPVRERLETLRQAVTESVSDIDPDLPERPEPETDDPDEGGWLYDSARGYLEQLAHYQRHKGGGDGLEDRRQTCPVCGREYIPLSKNRRMCSNACKWKARRQREKTGAAGGPAVTTGDCGEMKS
jgi:hypothetical protein